MRALVLSGGGARGAFQVGVIQRLLDLGHAWDLVAGVSVGALNALGMAMYPPAAQKDGAFHLAEMWHGIRGNDSVYTSWWGGPLTALWKGSRYDTAPLARLLARFYEPKRLAASGVQLLVGAVSLRTGAYRALTSE